MPTECLTSETIVNIVSSGGNKYVFNNSNTYSEDEKYGLGIGTYIFKNVPEAHPIAILNTNIQYVGDSNKKFTDVLDDGNTYDFYWGDVTVTISNDFGLSSVYCLYHGYMGGENLLAYSESCLLEPEPPPPPVYNKRCVLRFRRGTASEWTSSSPQPDGEVLKLGEPGYEKDTGKLKIGDGVSGWNNLAYLQAENSEDVILTQEDVDDAVANLLAPGNGIVLSYDDDQNSLTISTSGLQPAGNYATLINGLVPESQLPSYVDDVLEFANLASFPNPGEAGKIYVTLDTNKTYRWSGSTYIEISSGPSSSDDVPEGSINLYYTNDRVDDLLKAGSYINISYDSVDLTISATGLQPSGDYSVVGHPHVVSDITDFSGSVSGLIPIQELVGVSGISVIPSGTTRQISSNFIPGNGIAFNYNNDESLTISTITNNGIIPITNNATTSLSIPGGYVIGSLSIYQNGVKLLDGIDYIGNDSSDINFINIPTSGSYIEYATPTFNSNIQNLIDSSILSVYDTSIYDLGSVGGSVNINYGIDRLIQTLTLNGTTLALNKGTEWPTTNISRDIVLQISCVASTTVIWNIVGSNWYNKPTNILPGGEYLVLLRSIGDSTIQGHYIGNKQGSL